MTNVRHAGGGMVLALLVAGSSFAQQTTSEVVTELRVHGNYTIPDADVVRLAGVEPGDEIGPGAPDAIAARLLASERFDEVDVRKRYTSLTRSDAVVLIVVVRERPAPVRGGSIIRALDAARRQTLFLPILDHTEGHGFSYGARFTLVDVLGDASRVSVPLTVGGTGQAALELEKRFDAGPVHALRGGVGASRVENQHYLVDDRRVSVWFGADRQIVDALRLSTTVRLSEVRFGPIEDRLATYRVGVEVDTRRNTAFPRDAVFARAGWQWLDPGRHSAAVSMPQVDARGFLGLFGRTVLAVRAQYQGASAAVPAYAQPLLGGIGSVRGHRVGARAGDKLAAASAELRFPLSSPLRFGMLGLRVFFDTGATYNANERLGQTQFSHGAGAGVFLNAAFLTLQLDAAHDLRGGARLHFATGVSF